MTHLKPSTSTSQKQPSLKNKKYDPTQSCPIPNTVPLLTSSGIASIFGMGFDSCYNYINNRIYYICKHHLHHYNEENNEITIKHVVEKLKRWNHPLVEPKTKNPKTVEILNSGLEKEPVVQNELKTIHGGCISFFEQAKYGDAILSSTPDTVLTIPLEMRQSLQEIKQWITQTDQPPGQFSVFEKDFYMSMENANDHGVLEIKTQYHGERDGPHKNVPIKYWLQCMCQIHLSGARVGYLLSWTGTKGSRMWRISPNEQAWKYIRDYVDEFLEKTLYVSKLPPKRFNSTEKKQHQQKFDEFMLLNVREL